MKVNTPIYAVTQGQGKDAVGPRDADHDPRYVLPVLSGGIAPAYSAMDVAHKQQTNHGNVTEAGWLRPRDADHDPRYVLPVL